ncbi:MAG: hypothetical protein CL840_15745 [Crocinitomicaceae bacterium]|nr:hypothetical protein [Crocinitomicaceae bacterium]
MIDESSTKVIRVGGAPGLVRANVLSLACQSDKLRYDAGLPLHQIKLIAKRLKTQVCDASFSMLQSR